MIAMDMEHATPKDIVIVTLAMLHHIVRYKGREEVKTVDQQVNHTQVVHGSHGLFYVLSSFYFRSCVFLRRTIDEKLYRFLKKGRPKIGDYG